MTFAARSLSFCLLLGHLAAARAEVTVVANRSPRQAQLELIEDDRPSRKLTVEPGASVVLQLSGPAHIRLSRDSREAKPQSAAGQASQGGGQPEELPEYQIDGDSAYFLYETPGERGLGCRKIGLLGEESGRGSGLAGIAPAPARSRSDPLSPSSPRTRARIAVKILVDDDERAARRAWERRLQDRLQAASRLFEADFGVAFEVVAVDTWNSSNALDDFAASLVEFEQTVPAEPASVAIGFSSQYQIPENGIAPGEVLQGATDDGGVPAPLGSHLLVRERSPQFSERERFELLVHVLGHHLGAAHSPESSSVMRSRLGDRQALAQSFAVGFDPLNALAIGIVTEQLSRSGLSGLQELPPLKLRRLQEIYATLEQAMPEDRAASRLLVLTENLSAERPREPADVELAPESSRESPPTDEPQPVPARPDRSANRDSAKRRQGLVPNQTPPADEQDSLAATTREVLAAIIDRARRNADGLDGDEIDGDELTAAYVRSAAEAALALPAERRIAGFFCGLAIGLERTEEMRRYAVLGDFTRRVEPDSQRRLRLAVLGRPSWGRREDLLQHVTFSAAIAAWAGPRAAEAAGMAEELREARSASGFSFADWCADRAGIAWADQVKKGSITLETLADRFETVDYLPNLQGLEEGISWDEFSRRYGSTGDRRFRAVDADILSRIDRLYRSPRHAGSARR